MYIATKNKLPTTTAAGSTSTSTSTSISGSSITTSAMSLSPLPLSSSSKKMFIILVLIVLVLINLYPLNDKKFTATTIQTYYSKLQLSSLLSNSSNSSLSSTIADADAPPAVAADPTAPPAPTAPPVVAADPTAPPAPTAPPVVAADPTAPPTPTAPPAVAVDPTAPTVAPAPTVDDDYNDQYFNQYLDEGTSLRCTPLSKMFPLFSSSNLFNDDDKDNNNNNADAAAAAAAVCQVENTAVSSHFPHTMQQLYPCFSWWNAPQNNQNIRKKVLIMKDKDDNNNNNGYDNNNTDYDNFYYPNAFTKGILIALLSTNSNPNSSSKSLFFDFNIDNKIGISNSSVVVVSNNNIGSIFTMRHPNDAKLMRQIVFDYYNITLPTTTAEFNKINNNNNNNTNLSQIQIPPEKGCLTKKMNNNSNNSNSNSSTTALLLLSNNTKTKKKQQQQSQQQQHQQYRLPIIGFLNREKKSRRVTNYADIIKAVEEEFYNYYPNSNSNITNNNNNTNNIGVSSSNNVHYMKSFDGLSFVDQIKYMNQIDILIGPHGAQLTSIAFMSECSGILELFPEGYYIPEYFGTLARSTGHYHTSYYTGNIDNRTEEVKAGLLSYQTRSKARSRNIDNANPNIIIYGVKKLISNWQTCKCRNSSNMKTKKKKKKTDTVVRRRAVVEEKDDDDDDDESCLW